MKAKRIQLAGLLLLSLTGLVRGEVILQFFNNSWNEITARMPELAEVGYGALWLPPPQKASSPFSVGYDLWDPFDLGGKLQNGTIRTRYGTEADLLRLIATAHRFGMRVYFDNIMNHRAFAIPGWDANTPIDIYPGMVPEDFHLRVTEEGFYRPWDNTVNWGNTWEVQNRYLSGLIDIAHESPNANFGYNEGDQHPKISFVRHPDNPEYYDNHPTLGYVGFGHPSITTNVIAQNPGFYSEDVGAYLMRSIRWLVHYTKLDGLRLDAVKHVPDYFFGKQWGEDKDSSSDGYIGQAQWQFNMTRGFNDWDNHRDTNFDLEKGFGRNDLLVFGEHMGEPPPYGGYWDSGMRLLDARTHSTLNNVLGNPSATLAGLEWPGYSEGLQMGDALGVYYAKSHDDSFATREELHYAINLTRRGVPVIYTDGNRQAEVLGGSGGAFPRHANTAYLGQWGDNRIPNMVYIHNQFARGDQKGVWADSDYLAYERIDKRANPAMSDGDGVLLLAMINDNYASGQSRDIRANVSFGTEPFVNDAYLYNYSSYGGGFYVYGSELHNVIVPPGGYFMFGWRNPEESDLWRFGGGRPLTILQNGSEVGWMTYTRRDGPDGDPEFNPYGLTNRGYPTNQTPASHTYRFSLPRVTSATNLSFVSRVDGSAADVRFKLGGGMNLNTITHSSGDGRDVPPGNEGGYDVFLGYEQAAFVSRVGPEKFGSANSTRNKIGSAGAETFRFTVGSAGVVTNLGSGVNDFDNTHTASFVYHDPSRKNDGNANDQMWPAPQNAANQPIYLWIKTGHQFDINKVYLYYTTDGSNPEGAAGQGIGTTKAVPASFKFNWTDGSDINDWWEAVIPAQPPGTPVRYKISAFRQQDGSGNAPWQVVFPSGAYEVDLKKEMMGTWQVTNLNLKTLAHYPHNDFGLVSTGLVDGFHVVAARAFLERDNRSPIYNTFTQPFYLDTETPKGEVIFPKPSDAYFGNEYGLVFRTDPTVTEVWVNISDSDSANDDGQTGESFGNGTNALGAIAWAPAQSATASLDIDSPYTEEWRYTYRNIPTSGQAVIRIRLHELTSSTNMTLSASAGHYRELTITNGTFAPNVQFFFDWPTTDGTVVQTGWTVRVKFSSSIGDGFSDEQMRERFLVTVDGIARSRDDYRISRDVGGGLGQLEYDIPNIYNGDTNYLHLITVTYETGGGITLQANRSVKVASGGSQAALQVIDPPELDLDGQPFQIILPDVANPSPTQRQYRIRVETDLDPQFVWIAFTNSTGGVMPIDSATNALAGTVRVTQGFPWVTGNGTVFNQELGPGSVLLIQGVRTVVSQVFSSNQLALTQAYAGPTASNLPVFRIDGNPRVSGSKKQWDFLWTNLTAGSFTFTAFGNTNAPNDSAVHVSQTRTTRVLLRQLVEADGIDFDTDEDGLQDSWESEPVALPETLSETWNNGEVHIWYVFGRTEPLSPDTDGDGLPDGLESGWGSATTNTDASADTNGDGWPNFIADVDGPVFNTTDNWSYPRYNFNRSRTDLIAGSMTDPNNPDSDNDSLSDGIEDANRNGRVDIGLINGSGSVTGLIVHPNLPTFYNSSAVDRDSLPSAARFLETDPNLNDTDGDGQNDGLEDANRNGRVDLELLYSAGTSMPFVVTHATNGQYLLGNNQPGIRSRALDYAKLRQDFPRPARTNGVWSNTNTWPRLLVRELDPLSPDTNGDGLPDGWSIQYGLDPFDDGWYNLRTGEVHPVNSQQGPDGDLTGDGVSNWQHFLNGTDPRINVTNPPPAGSILVGRGSTIGSINGAAYYEEFMDWTWDDVLALDPYEGGGNNNQQGDIYMGWDGFDGSRDLVAFYARDGGAAGSGGTDRFYFRVDLQDLAVNAEDGNLDLYIVIDTGNQAVGERVLPDQVDTLTDMRWEAVVAVYKGDFGTVYLDTNPAQNTSTFGDDLTGFGGVDAESGYFLGAYYNNQLDAIEIAIDRQALLDVNWNGDPDTLNYQVFTTRDGTCNGCVDGGPGAGDIGGRSDIRDTIRTDWLAEDYYDAQAGLSGANSVLTEWIPGDSSVAQAKVAVLVHGNQALQPGSKVQDLINDRDGAGYHRALLAHEVFRQPLNLHVSATLASSIEWAAADTNEGPAWLDGPAFNDWIERLIDTNLVYLLAGTYADHMLPYFPASFNADNIARAGELLQAVYGTTFTSNTVFWTPERLLDPGVFADILAAGYRWTVLDQNTHLWKWFGRTDALGDNGYSINRIHGVNTFAINNQPSDFRFRTHDGGLNTSLRSLLNRRARGNWERVTVLFSNWEDFGNLDQADAWDANLRWMANRPWIRLVGLEEIASETLDLSLSGFSSWDAGIVDRGSPAVELTAHDWLNHATGEDYDTWYFGSALEEGLAGERFNVRTGVQVPKAYGQAGVSGTVHDAWTLVQGITETGLARLARSVLYASVFQTAFHAEDNNDLSRWSTGDYIYPDQSADLLETFARRAQAQSRFAAIYSQVDAWAAGAAAMTTTLTAQVDVDLDGETEYILANSRVYAIFERMGGRMTAAWTRDPADGAVIQMIGNHVSYPGVDTEEEGRDNLNPDGSIAAFRTSGFKDWVPGGANYPNGLYTATAVSNGWRLTSFDSRVIKTITLAPGSTALQAAYQVAPDLNGGVLRVRHGLSLNLLDLLVNGQATLGYEEHAGGVMTLANLAGGRAVRAELGYGDAGHNAGFNLAALDDNPGGGHDFATVPMRNLAQVHQVELIGTNTFAFSLSLEATSAGSDWEQWALDRGIPPWSAGQDSDVDGVSNWDEYIADTNPLDDADYLAADDGFVDGGGFGVRFATRDNRRYFIWINDQSLVQPQWSNATPAGISGTNGVTTWIDGDAGASPATGRFYRIGVELAP